MRSAPMITVFLTKYVPADSTDPQHTGVVMSLEDALALDYDTDAHYQTVRYNTSRDGEAAPRLSKASVIPHDVDDLIHDVLSFDLDTPGHVPLVAAPAAWASNVEHFLTSTALGRSATFYATRGGYRVLFVLDQPVSHEHYGAALRLMAEEMQRQGCPAPDPLYDWSRMMRLPCVLREGQRTDPDAGPLRSRTSTAQAPWSVTHEDLAARAAEAPVSVRRRLADGSVSGVAYSGAASEPRPDAPAVIPAALQTERIRAYLDDDAPLAEPGARHGATLRHLGLVALDLGSKATPDLLYAALHRPYEAMCAVHPDSSLDKLWVLAHEVCARHLARLANGQQEDRADGAVVRGVLARQAKRDAAAATDVADLPDPNPWDAASLAAFVEAVDRISGQEGFGVHFLRARLQAMGERGDRQWPILVALQGGGANDLWVFDRHNARYTGPTSPRSLAATIHKCGWAACGDLIKQETGDLAAPASTLLAQAGALVQRVNTFYADAHGGDFVDEHANHGAGVLWIAGARLRSDLTPCFDPQIAEWLRLLAGDDAELAALLDMWLAAVPDASNVAEHTIPALMLLGRKGTGKTLLAAGLSALWGVDPIGHEEAFGRFNARLGASPVVDGSEFSGSLLRPGRSGEGHDLRVMISQAPKQLEAKFMAPTSLLGSPRVILSANDFGAWGDSPLDEDSYRALVDRIAVLQPDVSAETYLLSLKTSDPGILGRWARRGIAEHVLALRDSVDLSTANPRMRPAPRFRVPSFGHTSSEEDTLRRIGDDGRMGLEALVRGVLIGQWPPLHADESVMISGRTLYITQAAFGACLEKQAKHLKGSAMRKVLGKLTSVGRAEDKVQLPRALRTRGKRTAEDRRRYVAVPLDLVELYAEHLGIEVDTAACAEYDDAGNEKRQAR